MYYQDKAIIEARRRAQESKKSNIYHDEILTENGFIRFGTVSLFEDKLTVMLPESYKDLSDELCKIKYPMEQRPEIVKSNKDATVNFAFKLHEIPFYKKDVEEAIKTYASAIYRLYPGTLFMNTETVAIHKSKVGYFDFISKGVHKDIYQIFAFMPLNNKMLQFVFNAPIEQRKTWEYLAVQVIASMETHER